MISRLLILLYCALLSSLPLFGQNSLEVFGGGNLSAISLSTDARDGGGFPYYNYRIKSYGILGSGGFQAGLRRNFTLPNDRIFLSAGIAYSNQKQVIWLTKDYTRTSKLNISFADRVDYLALPLRTGVNLGELSFKGGLTFYYALTRKFTENTPKEKLSLLGFNDSRKATFLENTANVNRFRTAIALSVGYQLPMFPRLGVELQYEKHLMPFWQTTVLGDTRTGSNFQLNLSYALRPNSGQNTADESASLIFIAGLGVQPRANLGKYPTETINYMAGLIGISKLWTCGRGMLETGIQYQERKFIQRGAGPRLKVGGASGDALQASLTENLQTRMMYISVPVLYRYAVAKKVDAKLGVSMHIAVRNTKTYDYHQRQPLSLQPAVTAGLSCQLSPTVAVAFMADQFVREVRLGADDQQYPLQFALQTEIRL